jgi:hypothetical protein
MTSSNYTTGGNGTTPIPPSILDNQIARKAFINRERAHFVAAVTAITGGSTQLETLNHAQIVRLCRVSLAYAGLMRVAQSAPRLQAAE